MAAIGFGINKLTGFSAFKPFGSGTIRFYFRHYDTPDCLTILTMMIFNTSSPLILIHPAGAIANRARFIINKKPVRPWEPVS